MLGKSRLAALGATVVAVGTGATGVMAATHHRVRPAVSRTTVAAAVRPARLAATPAIRRKVDRLVRRMTLDEKLNQLTLLSDGQINDAEASKPVGGVFSLTDPVKINHFQHVAVEQSRLHIPILFAYDTIHGYRTIFPIPLGTASSFDPSVAKTDHRIGAFESAAVGIKQIYSPMVDVSHEPRWGRISEAAGEDPFLNSVMAAARVKGAQGRNPARSTKVLTSVKHFVAYGQPEGGRDYNTTDMSKQRLWNFYLPPFKAAVDAGAITAMCSFNALNGVPGCANRYTETNILKRRWGFPGFIESDYTAVAELRRCPPQNPDTGPCGHGVAANGPQAAQKALNAGTDQEMVSTNYRDFGAQLVARGRVSMARIDDAVRRILTVKYLAGLFAHPYADPATAESKQLQPAHRAAARWGAGRSMVLLKNDDGVLPLDPGKSTAVIGPLGDDQHDMLGPWWGQGRDEDAVSVVTGMKRQDPNTTFTPACTLKDTDLYDPATECPAVDHAAVKAAAASAQQVVLTLGETRGMSGEAEVRSNLKLPGNEQQIIDDVASTGKPFAVVLFNGRPLDLSDVAAESPAILEAWFGGVEAGDAVADVLFGKVDPGGKLPVSFPRSVGQVPIYYNHEPTGRPCDVSQKYDSRYRDILSCDPLYRFGYGLSYTTFSVGGLHLSSPTVPRNGVERATVQVTNTGHRTGDDVVQLYIHDPVASIEQPIRRLRGFQRVTLQPGESRTVSFELTKNDFGFYDDRGRLRVEPGTIAVYAGDSSDATDRQAFRITR